MKKFFILLIMFSSFNFGLAQKASERDSILMRIDSLTHVISTYAEYIERDLSLKNRFQLYPTENIYTFLELDTKTGKMKQVQWSLDEEDEGTFYINDVDLTYGNSFGSNSFELYPTKNMYQFILLDKTNGRKWHVQWGIGEGKRWIRRIY
jgi:hypothetical protein